MTSHEWINIFTPVVGTLLTALVKRFAPIVPKPWIPVIAVLLGAGANLLGQSTLGSDPNGVLAGLLGLGGIGVYEITKPVVKSAKHSNKTTK